MADALLDCAIALCRRGIAVFPCRADKTPACRHGFRDAVSDEIGIRLLWWESLNVALVGVATGAMSGFDVVDIDPRHGGDEWLARYEARLPPTRRHQTRSGGEHFLFQHHVGLRCSTSRIAPGVDVRADGGSLIWWPASGFPVLNNAPIAPWPDWLLELAKPQPRPVFTPVNNLPRGHGYAAAALHRAVDAIACATEGTRNATLNKETYGLLRFVGSGSLSADEILTTLARAGLSAGLEQHEVISTLESAIRARGIA